MRPRNPFLGQDREWVRATEDAPFGPFHLLVRRHDLLERAAPQEMSFVAHPWLLRRALARTEALRSCYEGHFMFLAMESDNSGLNVSFRNASNHPSIFVCLFTQ